MVGRHSEAASNTRPPDGNPAYGEVGPTSQAHGSLSRRLKRGALASAVSLAFIQSISLAQTLIIARLLSPADIGLFAAGTVLTSFFVRFSEGGLRAALIQREHDVEDAAETVFWATLLTGILMSALALAVAPVVSAVFKNPVAGLIAAVTSGTLVLHALTNVPDALLQRRFDFRQRGFVDPSVAISYSVTSVVLCLLGYGVWGLVIATYVSMLVWVATTWTMAGWRPGRGRSSLSMWRRLRRFGAPLVIVEVNERFREIIETVLVGRGLNNTALGYYKYGGRIAMLPGVAIVQVCSYVLFPAFSRIAGDPVRLRRAFLRSLQWIWFAAVPVSALLVAIGEPLVVVLLGERWRGAGVVLMAMSGYGLGAAMEAVATESIKGCGQSRRLNWMTLTRLISTFGLLALLIRFGLLGVGLSVSISSILLGVLALALARPLAGVTRAEVARLLIPPVISALFAMGVIGTLEHLVTHADQRSLAVALGLLVAESLGFAALYLVVHRIVAPTTILELQRAIFVRLVGTGDDATPTLRRIRATARRRGPLDSPEARRDRFNDDPWMPSARSTTRGDTSPEDAEGR